MRKFTLFFLLFVSCLAVFTQPLMARTKDDVVPAEESVCDGLMADGITKGLFGLCVAYCEAEANSELVLETYTSMATGENDPPMPCLEVVAPGLSCPCWSNLTGSDVGLEAGLGLVPDSCLTGSAEDTITYGGSGFELLSAFPGNCVYLNSVTGGSSELPITPGAEAACRLEVLSFAVRDGFTCGSSD